MKKSAKSIALLLMCLILIFSAASTASAALDRVTGLRATMVALNTVQLTWDATPSAEAYEFQVNINGKEWKDFKTNNPITGTTYIVTGLDVGSTYQFRIRAYRNGKGLFGATKEYSERFSTVVSVTPTIGKVTGLKATAASMTSVKLSWTAVGGAYAYNIQKKVDGSWKTVKNVKSPGVSYTVTGLKANSTYSFRVRAYVKVDGSNKYGSSATLTYKAGVGKVTDFKISESDYNSATVSWSKISGVSGYQIYKYDKSNPKKGWYKVKTVYSSSTDKYTYGKLVTGTQYVFKVRAFYKTSSKTYYGDFCSTIYYTPKLAAPSNVTLTTLTATKAILSWNEVEGAEGYQVYDYATGSAKKLPTAKINKTVIDVKKGNVYKIKIRAYTKKSGKTVKGTFSDAFTFYSMPDAVKNFDASVLETGYAKFTWDLCEGASGYNLYVQNGSVWRLVASEITATSYTLKDSSLLKDNTFMLRAYVKNGDSVLEGSNSEEYTLTIISAPTVTLGECTDTDITIKWNSLDGVNGYIVESYDYNAGLWKIIGETSEPKFTDYGFKGAYGSGERGILVRVYGAVLDKNGNILSKGLASEPLSATTSGITIKQSDAVQTITWPAQDGAAKYRVIIKSKASYYSLPDTTVNSITTVLTPDAVNLITICAYDKNNTPLGYVTDDITFKTQPLSVLPASHSRYNESVNGQLLYLINAINNSKAETEDVTVSSTSTVSYSTDKFYLTTPLGTSEFEGDDVQGLLSAIGNVTAEDKDEIEDLALSSTETVNETLSFKNGIAKNSQNKSVNLSSFVEPASTGFTSLYDWENPHAWKNGFSSVKTTPLAGGGYTFNLTLKKESFGTSVGKTAPLYHPCFTTTVASLSYLSGNSSELENELSTVGNTVITATVNADGTLDSYTINSPYTMKIKYDVNNVLVDSFGMYLTGNVVSSYKFTR